MFAPQPPFEIKNFTMIGQILPTLPLFYVRMRLFKKCKRVHAKEKDQSCQTVNKGWNADVASTLSSHAHSTQLFMKLFVIVDSIPRLIKPIFQFSSRDLGLFYKRRVS